MLLATLMHAIWSALAYRFTDQAADFAMLLWASVPSAVALVVLAPRSDPPACPTWWRRWCCTFRATTTWARSRNHLGAVPQPEFAETLATCVVTVHSLIDSATIAPNMDRGSIRT